MVPSLLYVPLFRQHTSITKEQEGCLIGPRCDVKNDSIGVNGVSGTFYACSAEYGSGLSSLPRAAPRRREQRCIASILYWSVK